MPEDEAQHPLHHLVEFSVREMLTQHSSEGEGHILNAAYHFLMVRVLAAVKTDTITEEDFDLLAHESYTVFIEGNIRAFHTWLSEVGGMRVPDLTAILTANAELWEQISSDLKVHLTGFEIIVG